MRCKVVALSAMWLGCALSAAEGDERDSALREILKAPTSGATDPEVARHWSEVAQWKADRVGEVLQAMDGANPVALNWLAAAVDAILEQPGAAIPFEKLNQFVRDRERGVAARRCAYSILNRERPKLAKQLIPYFLNDPAPEFRRPAVEQLIEQAASLPDALQKTVYLKAFDAARDEDQVTRIAKALKELGVEADLARHYGFVRDWHVVGPFDNVGNAGFDQAFPPESLSIADLADDGTPDNSLSYEGKDGQVRWMRREATAATGEIDLNEALGKLKEVVGYGAAIFESKQAQEVELRLRLQNSFKIWLNGELIQSQAIGHTGNFFDQYTLPVRLKAGKNLIVVKSCQVKAPQPLDFFDTWHFSVRVCDATGTAVHSESQP